MSRVAAHSSGSSASTEIRARVSSLRLVSCVVKVVMDSGRDSWRPAIRRWNASGSREKWEGSAPTSVSVPSRVYR
ncbi:hypothetical protein AHiyo4_35750 [Arthrobacter sp. Hiyo4]|nr:hypothetical protein AHiyo4_35750 [Arthrobacter sp. Hiyo4]